jgi:predicted CXXCH cytochrome family protein
MRDEFAMKSAQESELFRPGEDLDRTRYYIRHPAIVKSAESQADFEKNPNFFRERWWDDGTILAGGREYSALSVTACYQRGQISCLSCHSMHESDPVDQLKGGMETSQACTQCHDQPQFTTEIQRHTRHQAKSSGSECMNCHMPFVTYALLGAIRSHQISSPRLAASVQQGVPNACNLCHLDKTLAWTREHLPNQNEPVELSDEQRQTSAALLWLLKGDAAQRVITSWHLGWEPAQRASGADWLAPFQAQLLADPYGVVRYVAQRGLRTLPGLADVHYDFLASEADRVAQVDEVMRRWLAAPKPPSRTGAEVLLDVNGRLMTRPMRGLLNQRNNRRVVIQE